MSGKFNTIYKELVENDQDFLGILAYSVYKKQKTELIEDLKTKCTEGHELPQTELNSFYALSRSPTQLAHYKAQAETLAGSFAALVYVQEIDDEKERLKSAEFQRKLDEVKPAFWTGVWTSVVGSLVFTILLGLLVFFSWSLKQGPKELIESIFDVQILPKKERVEAVGSTEQD